MNLPPPPRRRSGAPGDPGEPDTRPGDLHLLQITGADLPPGAASASRRSVATSIVSYIFGGIGYAVIIAMTATSYQPSSSRWYFRPSWR
jgi:hypothetical protein